MCQVKPGPRCTSHVMGDLAKAEKAVADHKQNMSVLTTATDGERARLQADLRKKETILAKRDHQFSVSVVGGERGARTKLDGRWGAEVNASNTELVNAQKIVERADALRASGEWESVRREHHLRKKLASYESERVKGGAVADSALAENPRLLVDALTLVSKLPKSEGGRDLTADEKKQLKLNGPLASSAEDYLPAENAAPVLPESVRYKAPTKTVAEHKLPEMPKLAGNTTKKTPVLPQSAEPGAVTSRPTVAPVLPSHISGNRVAQETVTGGRLPAGEPRKPQLAPRLPAPKPVAQQPAPQKKSGWKGLLGL